MTNQVKNSFSTAMIAMVVLFASTPVLAVYQQPRVLLAAMKLLDVQLFEQRFQLTLRIQNPNDEPLRIRGLSYTVVINERVLVDGINSERLTIVAHGQTTVELEAVSDLSRIVDQFKALEHLQTLSYRLYGHITLDGTALRLPFEYRGDFGGHLPSPLPPSTEFTGT